MATKTMFYKREKVQVLKIKQQNDKHTQEYPLCTLCCEPCHFHVFVAHLPDQAFMQ